METLCLTVSLLWSGSNCNDTPSSKRLARSLTSWDVCSRGFLTRMPSLTWPRVGFVGRALASPAYVPRPGWQEQVKHLTRNSQALERELDQIRAGGSGAGRGSDVRAGAGCETSASCGGDGNRHLLARVTRKAGQCRRLLESLVSATRQLQQGGAAVAIATALAPPAPAAPASDWREPDDKSTGDEDRVLRDLGAMHAELGLLREMLVDAVAQRVGDDCVANASECALQ